MSPRVVGTRCWLRAAGLTHGWTMLMWCEEVPRAFLFICQCYKDMDTYFFSSIPIISFPSRKHNDQHSSVHNPLNNLDRCIILLWFKRRQAACLTGTCSALTSWDWTLCEKGYFFLFLYFIKTFICFFASKLCFYLHLRAHKCTPWMILDMSACQI